MKNILKSALLLLCTVGLFAACDDDRDNNPTIQDPTSFVLNTPATASDVIDLANSTSLNLTCSQPDYGFPAFTVYTVEAATKSDMSDAVTVADGLTNTRFSIDAANLAATLTSLEVAQGKQESDFPMTIPVYFRATAQVISPATKDTVPGSKIVSNVVAFQKVNLVFSLPPLTAPSNLYVVGNFCNWDWNNSLTMTEVYGSRDNSNTTATFWHMVYIDDKGIKFNTNTNWDGGEKGFSGITVDPASELGSSIQASSDGNIASSAPGWYLMIVKATVNGRNIDYTVTFNKPEVYLIGVAIGGWDEGNPAGLFTAPTTADGEFVSPALPALPGTDDGCIRMYCKVPGYDWWKSEFIVGGSFGTNIAYRGTGGDQERVGCTAGQKVYLNFLKDTGSIK